MKLSKAIKITIIYVLFAGLWIILSDHLIILMAKPLPPTSLVHLQAANGAVFVLVTALLLFFLVRREMGLLNEAQERLTQSQAILNASPMVVCRWKNQPGWPVAIISENALEIFGYSADAFTSGEINYTDMVHPDDLERISREVVHHLQVEKRDAFSQNYRIITKDGQIKWIEDRTLVCRNVHGRITHFQGIVFDITEKNLADENLRRQKELLQTILDNIPLMVVFNEADGRMKWANRAWEQNLGWTLAEAQQVRVLNELYPDPEDRKRVLEAIRQSDGSWQPSRITTRDGQVLDTSWTVIKLSDDTKIGLGQDISELKQEERKRRDLEVQLYQAQKMEAVGRLAGGVAHDFNNLLSVVIGYTDLLLRKCDDHDDFKEPLQRVLEAADRAKSLTRQLLAFGRKQMLDVNVFDVNGVIADFEKMVRRMLGDDIEVLLSLTQTPCMIKADLSQIEQVLMNLVINARDAMPDGGTITIETDVRDIDKAYTEDKPEVVPGTYAMIAISDTGMGMDRETSNLIFEPFFTTKGEEKGTGLGLSTVYGIVKQHRGNIYVYSELDRGTTFKIYLPFAEEMPDQQIDVDEQPLPERLRGTVMVVEDETAVREMTCSLLTNMGLNVLSAESVQEAVEMAESRNDPIDLLLTDVVMPGMKGPEVYQRIVQRHPNTKVIYMSGYTENVIVNQGVLQPGIHFLQKPISVKTLHDKVARVLTGDGQKPA